MSEQPLMTHDPIPDEEDVSPPLTLQHAALLETKTPVKKKELNFTPAQEDGENLEKTAKAEGEDSDRTVKADVKFN